MQQLVSVMGPAGEPCYDEKSTHLQMQNVSKLWLYVLNNSTCMFLKLNKIKQQRNRQSYLSDEVDKES